MKAGQAKPTTDLSMSSKEFDWIMGRVLQVKPKDAKALNKSAKVKTARKKQLGKK